MEGETDVAEGADVLLYALIRCDSAIIKRLQTSSKELLIVPRERRKSTRLEQWEPQ